MNKFEKDRLLDDFISGQITEQDLELLKDSFVNEAEFLKTMKIRNDILMGVQYSSDSEFKSMLNDIHERVVDGGSNKSLISKYKKLYFTTFGIFLIIFAVFFRKKLISLFDNQDKSFYAYYYHPYSSSSETRSIGPDSNIIEFGKKYRSKEYVKAFEIISPILSEVDNELKLKAGITAMELDQYSIAIKLFDEIILDNDIYFNNHALWYKSMLFLKQDKESEAKPLLKLLSSDANGDHYHEASELLNKLNKK